MLLLLTVLPGRVRLLPVWVPLVVVSTVLLPMAGVTLAAARARWLRVERAIRLLFWHIDRGARKPGRTTRARGRIAAG